jgi:hypothetical protein
MPIKKQNKKVNKVSEPTLTFNDKTAVSNEKKSSSVRKDDKEVIISEAFSKSRFLANSISFYSSFLKAKNSDEKILPFIYLSLITASELRIHNNILEEFYNTYCNKINNFFEGNVEEYKNWGFALFVFLISEKPQKYGSNINPDNTFSYMRKAVELISEVRNGKKSANAMLEFIKSFKDELDAVQKLEVLIQDVKENDPFLNLPQINDKILKIIEKEELKEQYIKYWIQIIKALGYVLENSTKDPKDVILDFLSDKTVEKSELDILLFALFVIRLFYGAPFEKVIPLSFLDENSMNLIAPLSEVFINPKPIIEGAKKSKIKIEEYYWTYVWGKPHSIFDNPTKKEVKKFQRKLVEVEEEVIVEEKNFGDFIKVYGEPKSTGFIRLKTAL